MKYENVVRNLNSTFLKRDSNSKISYFLKFFSFLFPFFCDKNEERIFKFPCIVRININSNSTKKRSLIHPLGQKKITRRTEFFLRVFQSLITNYQDNMEFKCKIFVFLRGNKGKIHI
jgi:hypothetical protein